MQALPSIYIDNLTNPVGNSLGDALGPQGAGGCLPNPSALSGMDAQRELSGLDTPARLVRREQVDAATSCGLVKITGLRAHEPQRTIHRQDRLPTRVAVFPHRGCVQVERRTPPTYIVGRGCPAESHSLVRGQIDGPANSEKLFRTRRPVLHSTRICLRVLYSPRASARVAPILIERGGEKLQQE